MQHCITCEPCLIFYSRAHMNYSVQALCWWTWCLVSCACLDLCHSSLCCSQTRQIRSLWGQSRRASSQCVLMLRCHACQMRCTLTRWPLKCSMVEAVAGTVGTAGLTKHCRYIIWSVNPVYVHRVDRNPDISRTLFYISQFIIGEDGSCGLTYEHAPAEGPPVVFLVDHVVDYM